MRLNEEIDKRIEEYQEILDVDFFESFSNVFSPMPPLNNFGEIKNINKEEILKNRILLFFMMEEMKKYKPQDKEARKFLKQTNAKLKKLNARLEEKGLNYIYEGYEKHHVLNRMNFFAVNVYSNYSEVTFVTKENFAAHGIENLFDQKKEMQMQKILNLVHKKLVKENIDCIFENNFLEDVLSEVEMQYEEEDLMELKTSLYDICCDIDESFTYVNKKHKWEIYKELGKCFEKDVLKCTTVNLIKLTNDLQSCFHISRENEKKDAMYKMGILVRTKQYLTDPDLLKKNLNNLNFSLLQSTYFGALADIFKIVFDYQENLYKKARAINTNLNENETAVTIEDVLREENMLLSVASKEEKEQLLIAEDPLTFVKKLKALNITTNNILTKEFITLLNSYSLKEINGYSYLIEKGYISRDTAFKFMSETTSLDKINANLEFLMEQKIDPKLPNYDENILFLPMEQLERNKDLLFTFYHKNKLDNNFNYLCDSLYMDALDFFIENGLDLSLLDNNRLTKEEMYNFIKRTQICSSLDIDIYTPSGNINRSFLLGKGFYCKAEDLDEYRLVSDLEDEYVLEELNNAKRDHINEKIYNLEVVENLEKYRSEDGLTYEIEEMILSRPKVMRNLTYFYEQNKITENNILQSIIFNSNLENKEIETIKEKVIPLSKRKQL